MPIKKWNAEAEEEKKTAIFQESFDELLEAIMQPEKFTIRTPGTEIPPTPGFIPSVSEDGKVLTLHRTNMHTYELEELETTFRAIKDDCSLDELDYILKESDEYYSDRRVHLRKRGGYSETCGHEYKFANMKKSKVQTRNNGRFR
jgi:hypothetical protein